jgi:metal-responsive CopG/Arc/MetJ family transcriptional regulator
MKTAVSIPDPIFARAEKIARSKGVSRSQVFTWALQFYFEQGLQREQNEIEAINQFVDEVGLEALAVDDLNRTQLNALADEGW